MKLIGVRAKKFEAGFLLIVNIYQSSHSLVTVLAGCAQQGTQQPVHSSEDGLVAEELTTQAGGPHCTLQNIKGPGAGAWICNSSPCRVAAGMFLQLTDSQPILTSELQTSERLCLKSKADSVLRNDRRFTNGPGKHLCSLPSFSGFG